MNTTVSGGNQSFKRFEFKYVTTPDVASNVIQALKPFTTLDPRAARSVNTRYVVRSLYFDDPESTFFYEKIDGIKVRHKYRLRTYGTNRNTSEYFFLEQKGRHNQKVFKSRICSPIENLSWFERSEGIAWLESKYQEDKLVRQYIFDTFRRGLLPTVLVEYDRQPFFSEYDPFFRITFDTNLRCRRSVDLFPTTGGFYKCVSGYVVIEVKFLHSMPNWFHRIIQIFELNRVSISKYVVGMKTAGMAIDLS